MMMMYWKLDALFLDCSNCGHSNKLYLQETIRLVDHHYKLELNKDKKRIIKSLEWMIKTFKQEEDDYYDQQTIQGGMFNKAYSKELQEAIDLLADLKGEE